jgi:hypothetical protein
MWGSLRDWLIVAVLCILGFRCDRQGRASDQSDSASNGHHVILVVSDGLRWQEVFRGADSILVFGDAKVLGGDAAGVRGKYWRPTLAERRQALMPFVWNTLARQGTLIGNRDVGSRVNVTNGMKFSYPGYNEMLVGYPDARIDRNTYGPNPNTTVFEWLNTGREMRGRVAAFGTWDTFQDIFNSRRSGLDVRTTGGKPYDMVVHRAVMPYLEQKTPRALFVGYAETDDHAHAGRYDRFLDAAHNVDAYLGQLWAAVQANPRYRGKTTLIFTADHGRGRTASDWTDHGQNVPGAEETFVIMVGPETAGLGELRNAVSFTESQVAATVAAALGLDYRRHVPRAAGPIRPLRRATARAR